MLRARQIGMEHELLGALCNAGSTVKGAHHAHARVTQPVSVWPRPKHTHARARAHARTYTHTRTYASNSHHERGMSGGANAVALSSPGAANTQQPWPAPNSSTLASWYKKKRAS